MTAPFEKPDRVVRFGGTAAAPTAGEFDEPPSGKKDIGWIAGDAPPADFWNWLTYKSYEWFRWVDERIFDLASGVGVRIKAPIVDTSADNGGDIEILGADSGADADKNGGDALIGGGDATGAGSSSITLQAATRGAAGVAARVKENYLRADGNLLFGTVYGRLVASKPLFVIPPTNVTAPAIRGDNSLNPTGGFGVEGKGGQNAAGVKGVSGLLSGAGVHGAGIAEVGVLAEGVTSGPTRGAARFNPQNAQPSGPNVVGDMYVTTAGVLKICTVAGSPGTWVSVGAQV